MNLFRRFVAAGAMTAIAATGVAAMAMPAHAATFSPSVLTTKISASAISKAMLASDTAVLVRPVSADQIAVMVFTKGCLLGAEPCPDLPQLPEPKCPVGPLTLCSNEFTFSADQARMLAKYDGIKIVDVAKYSKLRWLLKHFCEVHPEICEGVQEVPEIPIPDPGPWFQLDDVLLREVNTDLAKAIVQVPEINLDRILIGR
ncbi:MAG: hypothetical protein AB7L13_10115 [Acidimicrobiia bacterium]